jgi:hypothetical protein
VARSTTIKALRLKAIGLYSCLHRMRL